MLLGIKNESRRGLLSEKWGEVWRGAIFVFLFALASSLLTHSQCIIALLLIFMLLCFALKPFPPVNTWTGN